MGSVATVTTGQQFGRIANLIVANQTGGRDLSSLRFKFEVRQCDTDIPNTLIVKIYNLSRQTEEEILKEYTQVALQVGYKGTSVEMLFSGDIKYFRRGKENSTDRFLEITAGDNDLGYNYGFLQATLGPGATPGQIITAAAEAINANTDNTAVSLQTFGGAMPRGKVLFGLGRVYLDQVAATANAAGAKWFVENGVLKFVSTTGYLPGNAVVLTPATGLIGIPEATIDGIEGRCLMNAGIKIGCELQIAAGLIVQTSTTAQQAAAIGPGFVNAIPLPNVTNSLTSVAKPTPGLGIYRVVVVEHSGDTRNNEWYSDFTCLTIDASLGADATIVGVQNS